MYFPMSLKPSTTKAWQRECAAGHMCVVGYTPIFAQGTLLTANRPEDSV